MRAIVQLVHSGARSAIGEEPDHECSKGNHMHEITGASRTFVWEEARRISIWSYAATSKSSLSCRRRDSAGRKLTLAISHLCLCFEWHDFRHASLLKRKSRHG